MAARATRSVSRKARVAEAVATGPLGALSHDELGVIVDGLADPLQPVVAVALSSTCLGLRTPLQTVLEVLKERHGRAVALCRKLRTGQDLPRICVTSCAELCGAGQLECYAKDIAAHEAATLGMILGFLPKLEVLCLHYNTFDEASANSFSVCLRRAWLPSLTELSMTSCSLGRTVAEALAAAIRQGALPKLEILALGGNSFGTQGGSVLAAPLRTLPALRYLQFWGNDIGDEGVASLLDNLGKDDFKKLDRLGISENKITDVGCATIVASLNTGAMPALEFLSVFYDGSDEESRRADAVANALQRAKERRGAALG